MADHGATQELKPQNKSILYLFWGNEPSTTVRGTTFLREWEKRGVKVACFYLRSPFIHNRLKKHPRNIVWRVAGKIYYILRRYILTHGSVCKRYDTIVAVKYVPATVLQAIKNKMHVHIIYDFDDAVWLDTFFFGEETFRQLVSTADAVTADNTYLANHAAPYNPRSFVVNGPCQIEQFNAHETPATQPPGEDKVILGWCGSPPSLHYFYKIYDALEAIGSRYPNVVLKLLGTGNRKDLIPPFEKIKISTVPWYNQAEMISHVKGFDVGLYPLFYNELSLGRGALKATIYMSAKVPVIADAMGENLRIITDGENGMLAASTDEWIDKLALLIESKPLRTAIGQRGWEYAMQHYTVAACCDQMINVINRIK
jgi:glycosyltransferase involved in cell wall biosynthesis